MQKQRKRKAIITRHVVVSKGPLGDRDMNFREAGNSCWPGYSTPDEALVVVEYLNQLALVIGHEYAVEQRRFHTVVKD